jgi:transmembrane sensor
MCYTYINQIKMNQQELNNLIDKVNEGLASEEELALYTIYINQITSGQEDWDLQNLGSEAQVKAELFGRIESEIRPAKKIRLWPRIAVTAAAVAVVVFGVWFYNMHDLNGRHAEFISASPNYANDVAAGKNTATLTLSNGKVIHLSDAKTGVVVGSELKYNDGSVVQYSSGTHFSGSQKGDQKNTGPVGVHSLLPQEQLTASTPRGGTYQIILPDGTKVWLNADSKISFPSQFTGDTRKVTLSGEAYFEVAAVMIKEQGAKMPFIVVSNGQEVEVLGTHFNINAYTDEVAVKTTLLEGSVRVSSLRGGTTRQPHDEIAASRRAPRNDDRNNDGRSSDEWAEGRGGKMEVLRPGEQSLVTGSNQIKVQQVDVNEAVAWKNGMFTFTNTDIGSIMRMISRWYNVEVVYQGKITETSFGGSVSRSLNISEILKVLELTDEVHFTIEGRRITIMP